MLRTNPGLKMFAPEDATPIPHSMKQRGDILDFFMTFRGSDLWEVRTNFELTSDHFPVTAKLGGDPLKEKVTTRIDWGAFAAASEHIKVEETSLENNDINQEAQNLTAEIQAALEGAKSTQTCSLKNHLGLTAQEKAVIRRKNEAKRIWAQWRRERDKIAYRKLEQEAKAVVAEARSRKLSKEIDKANVDNGQFWQLLRALGRRSNPNAPLRHENKYVFKDKEKAKVAANFLRNIFSNGKDSDPRTIRKAERSQARAQGPSNQQEPPPEISMEHLQAIISTRAARSSPGEETELVTGR